MDIKPEISVEFFPPKTEEGARQILRTANKIKNCNVKYASITYGAGGTTRERTVEYASLLGEIFNFNMMPHLTCVEHSVDDLRQMLRLYQNSGLTRVMALRGDPPKNSAEFRAHPNGLKHASELVSLIKSEFPSFKVYAACYPEKHFEAKTLQEDIAHLKIKADCGVDYFISQLFFENSHFYKFMDMCETAGITQPIIPGLLPALSFEQVQKFCTMSNAYLPEELAEKLKNAPDAESARKIGTEWTLAQIKDLLAHGVNRFHLYIVNRSDSAVSILNSLKNL